MHGVVRSSGPGPTVVPLAIHVIQNKMFLSLNLGFLIYKRKVQEGLNEIIVLAS